MKVVVWVVPVVGGGWWQQQWWWRFTLQEYGMSMISFQWSMMVGMTARMPRMPASLALALALAGAGQLVIT